MGVTAEELRGALLEREDALATLERAAREAAGGLGSLVAVRGAAGLGKTRLLGELSARAEEVGLSVLAARGIQLERGFGFGVARQLLDPPIMQAAPADRRRVFAGAAALAEPLFGGDPTPVDPTGFAVLNGLWWLVATLAMDRPLALLVDDVQWADAASMRWLAFLASRVNEVPVLAVAAGRTDEPDAPVEWSAMGDRAIDLLPLSMQGTGNLLGDLFASRPAAEFAAACHAASGGNPFLVTELARELRSRGVAPAREEASTVARVTPDTVARLVVDRLAAQPGEVARLARATAVLGDSVRLLDAAELAGLEEQQSRQVAVWLVELGILRRAARLTFEHPMVRDAIYESIAPVVRAGMHAAAAVMLERRREGVERRAAHLLLTEPAGDQHVVSVLREAAEVAGANGAIDSAREYLTRALAEPPASCQRPAVLAELGRVELQVGGPDAAAHLHEAAASASDRAVRERAAVGLVSHLTASGAVEKAVDFADEQRALAQDETEILALETELFTVASLAGAATWAKLAQRLHALEDRALAAGDAGRPLLGIMALDEIRRGQSVARAGELALAALENDVLLAGGAEYRPLLHACFAGARAGHNDRVYEVLSRAVEDAQRRGSLLGFAIALCFRALTFRYRDTASAAADLRIALEATREHGWTLLEWQTLNFYLLVLVERGTVDEAQAELERAGLEGELPTGPVATTGMLSARGSVRYAQGRWRECYDDFIEAGRREAPYSRRSQVTDRWRADAAMALAHLGEHDEALALAQEDLAIAREWGHPVSIGRALRACGLTCGAHGIADLEESVRVLESSAEIELAASLVELGAALRRIKRRSEARTPLRRAIEVGQRSGALRHVERARMELAATGARPRAILRTGVDSLTPSELRIARLAAGGLSNPEIAQQLFVTRKTVEAHLGHIYPKLDINRREQLAAALGGQDAAG